MIALNEPCAARMVPSTPSSSGQSYVPTTRPPDTPTDLVVVRRGQPDRPSKWNRAITPAVDVIVRKLLAPNAADRYQTAADLRPHSPVVRIARPGVVKTIDCVPKK